MIDATVPAPASDIGALDGGPPLVAVCADRSLAGRGDPDRGGLPPAAAARVLEAGRADPAADHAGRDRAGGRALLHPLRLPCEWVGDAPGLVLGRIVCQLVNEAAFAIGEGVGSADDVDAGMTLGLNHPRGPVAGAGGSASTTCWPPSTACGMTCATRATARRRPCAAARSCEQSPACGRVAAIGVAALLGCALGRRRSPCRIPGRSTWPRTPTCAWRACRRPVRPASRSRPRATVPDVVIGPRRLDAPAIAPTRRGLRGLREPQRAPVDLSALGARGFQNHWGGCRGRAGHRAGRSLRPERRRPGRRDRRRLNADPGGRGSLSAFVVFGKPGSDSSTWATWAPAATASTAPHPRTTRLLRRVAADANGDGRPEVIVGAPRHDRPDIPNAGAAFVSFGKATPTPSTCRRWAARATRSSAARPGSRASRWRDARHER